MNTNSAHISKNTDAVRPIFSITPFTLLDYPDKTACIFWFAACNMQCLYCYNPEIVKGKGKYTFAEAITFLKTRINLLDAVVLSGGECTLHRGLEKFVKEIKSLGFLVKIDTNGTMPHVMENLIVSNLIDYTSLDFKAPPKKFTTITKSKKYLKFNMSLDLLLASKIPFEVRTTLHSDLLDTNDILIITQVLEQKQYKGTYYLQNFMNDTPTLGELNRSDMNYIKLNQLNTKYKLEVRNN